MTMQLLFTVEPSGVAELKREGNGTNSGLLLTWEAIWS